MTIGEISRLTGVTIRTLRHYDQIGLLHPAQITDAGYRLYDDASLQRLHTILLFRELELPLADIRHILDQTEEDPRRILQLQRTLLTMRRAHIDRLIALTHTLEEKGLTHMDFSTFDQRHSEDLTKQAEAAWGHTDTWQEYARRETARKPGDSARYGQQLMQMLGDFGRSRPATPDAPEAQAFVGQLQAFMTDHFYTCTDEVLLGLADMYETDSFRNNIDRAGGEGTASFIAQAIRIRCGA